MSGHFGFSYTGLIFLILLFIPNTIWTKRKPLGYTPEKESKFLLLFERAGEALTCCCALVFSDFNIQKWTAWSWWLIGAFILMAMYELWWVRYFRSGQQLSDFYSSFLFIPLAGATLPVIAFFMLGIYGRVVWMLIATIILGIGHIGIHIQHKKELDV
ncbi:MAG: hypothetical protein K2O16_02390 [Lachnospiraceae bacterium]|nr:hypothetical protein [Lachnospiraceae bacterium]